MCGICGWFDGGSSPLLDISSLEKMAATMVHRGPDASGTFLHERVGLAHRRLKIIDLEGGGQPMSLPNGLTTVFNGEIYNYIELKGELEAKGHTFRTKSDTEVLLAAYGTWGEGCLEKFNGMFAFAVYDAKKEELFFARDRMGKKPFYYYHSGGIFAFASEIKSLLTLPPVRESLDVDPRSISDFLSLGYILAPKTVFNNIHKLPAAHYGTFNPRDQTITVKEYWRLAEFYHPDRKIAFTAASADHLRELIYDACRIRMRSDVPFGAFLSGGLDSSSIAAAMREASSSTVTAFSAGFDDASFDETRYASLAAQFLNVEHVHFKTRQPGPGELSKLVWFFDEPFADTSLMPTFQLNRETRKYVTVALSGDGADEIFAGYPTYQADRHFRFYRRFPAYLQRAMYSWAACFLRPSYRKVSFDYKVLQFLKSGGLSAEKAHYWWRVIFSDEEKKRIMSPDIVKECGGYDPYNAFDGYYQDVRQAGFLDKTLYVDQKTWLQDDILVKADRMSMANSVEVRSPFLDHRIVEYAAMLPENAKQSGGEQKVALKRAIGALLPDDIISRKKQGFNAPAKEVGKTRIQSPGREGLFSGGYILDGAREDITYKSFCFAVIEKWCNMLATYRVTGEWKYDE